MLRDVSNSTHTFREYQNSVDTGNPVRVVRGFKNRSEYGPEEGSVKAVPCVQRRAPTDSTIPPPRYRYDGLYQVISVGSEREIHTAR
jgi:hypothetical protein